MVRCRFFHAERYERGRDVLGNLKSNDRRRMKQRPAFARFVDEWAPRLMEKQTEVQEKLTHSPSDGSSEVSKPSQITITREDVLEEALRIFDKRQEHDKKVEEWREGRMELEQKRRNHVARKEMVDETERDIAAWRTWVREIESCRGKM